MQASTIVYLGEPGLQTQILASYFSKLDLAFQPVCTRCDLIALVDTVPCPIIVLALHDPPAALMRLVHELISSPLRMLPHVFILHEDVAFDTDLDTVTVLSGSSKLTRLVNDIRALLRSRHSERLAA